ncbi:MAG: hypothetical protein JWM85_342 [Acidimicrobiaceae bacterium]|jgi:glycerol-3-phosphate dehydrogenase (NAD(P)+)|nr:hypothetical protein [Acidimicrobiaceae bacterium]
MTVVTILGAGAMGSAFCTPVIHAGGEARLWGTTLDDRILEALRRGKPHPGTGVMLPAGVHVYDSDQLVPALSGTEVVVFAVSSPGIFPVLAAAEGKIPISARIVCATKGFVAGPGSDEIELGITAIDRAPATTGIAEAVAVGGPCKANEIASARSSIAMFAGRDARHLRGVVDAFESDSYAVATSNDVVGVEVSAALKNAYAIAMGYAEGVGEAESVPFHDLRAVVFVQATVEMSRYSELLGGSSSTAWGLAGMGDLEVTAFSGRNRLFGLTIGRGVAPGEAAAQMEAEGMTIEGLPAVGLASELASRKSGAQWHESFPLLSVLDRMVRGEPVGTDELFLAAHDGASQPNRVSARTDS